MRDLLKNTKGESRVVGMGIGLIMIITLGYIMFPIINGVSTAIKPANATASWGANIATAYDSFGNGTAGAVTLFGVAPIVFAAAIILVILTVYLAKQ